MSDPLAAVSPLDGRYADRTAALSPYVSESALMQARVKVEVEYLCALADLVETPLSMDDADREALRERYRTFTEDDAARIKTIETAGTDDPDRPATNHDVKAVEYFVRDAMAAAGIDGEQWVHFALTSEDVTNLAYRLLIRDVVNDVITPALQEIRDDLASLARDHRDLPMLARTHGQPATPTTFGKEMAVFAARLGRAIARIETANDDLTGKLAGASGTYAAHAAAYPSVDWRAFARTFVTDLGLEFVEPVTQVHPSDDLAGLFDALRGANQVLLDLDRDIWAYVSRRYLGQETVEGEVGSSTMPHKVNPIDFENSEGNLAKANSDLVFLGEYLTTSRLQRDLSDSTVKRNIGAALAHCLLGYRKTADGLAKVVPNESVMAADLEAHPEVIGEAVQTILRREGHGDAYERVHNLTRGVESVSLADFRALFADLDVPSDVREELEALTPAGYIGVGPTLADVGANTGDEDRR